MGIDISPAMLHAAVDREAQGDLPLGDLGQGIPFKPGSSDGCMSISAVQCLCNAHKTSDIPAKCLCCFFSLYSGWSVEPKLFCSCTLRTWHSWSRLHPRPSRSLHWWCGGGLPQPCQSKAVCLFSAPSTFLPKGLNKIKDEEEARESTFTKRGVPTGLRGAGGEEDR